GAGGSPSQSPAGSLLPSKGGGSTAPVTPAPPVNDHEPRAVLGSQATRNCGLRSPGLPAFHISESLLTVGYSGETISHVCPARIETEFHFVCKYAWRMRMICRLSLPPFSKSSSSLPPSAASPSAATWGPLKSIPKRVSLGCME